MAPLPAANYSILFADSALCAHIARPTASGRSMATRWACGLCSRRPKNSPLRHAFASLGRARRATSALASRPRTRPAHAVYLARRTAILICCLALHCCSNWSEDIQDTAARVVAHVPKATNTPRAGAETQGWRFTVGGVSITSARYLPSLASIFATLQLCDGSGSSLHRFTFPR